LNQDQRNDKHDDPQARAPLTTPFYYV
jgi:hypothetical protein